MLRPVHFWRLLLNYRKETKSQECVAEGQSLFFHDKIGINAHRKDRLKLSQKLYNVTCEIQQVRRHVNDLVKDTCPGHSAHAPVRSFTLRAEIALFTEALVRSDTDTSVATGWLTFGNSAEVSLPARTAAALARGGVVAVSTEPGTIRGQCLGRLNCDSAFLRHQRSFGVYDLVEFSIVSLGHTLTA